MNDNCRMEDYEDSSTLFFCVHRGSSMVPALREFDLLEIAPYPKENLRRGDVIAFYPPGKKELIIHRIVDISSQGVHTRGDNTSRPDAYVLSFVHIQGKVQAVWRGRTRKRLLGGRLGLLLSGVIRYFRWQGMKRLPLLRKIYHLCSRSGIFSCCLPPIFKTRVVIFQRHDELCARLLFGSRMIGHYHFPGQHWKIQRPYRLFINDRKLPVPQFSENPSTSL